MSTYLRKRNMPPLEKRRRRQIDMLEHILDIALEIMIPICELCGLVVVSTTVIRAIVGWLKAAVQGKKAEVSVDLDEGLSLGLGFLLGAEIMKTMMIRSVEGALEEAILVAAIFGLRALMSLLLHHEMKQERSAEQEKKEDASAED